MLIFTLRQFQLSALGIVFRTVAIHLPSFQQRNVTVPGATERRWLNRAFIDSSTRR